MCFTRPRPLDLCPSIEGRPSLIHSGYPDSLSICRVTIWSNPVVQIRGKVNNIALDTCIKTGVVFSDVIASCEVNSDT